MINLSRITLAARLIAGTLRKYRTRFLAMLMLGLASGLLESFGIGATIPLFYAATGQAQISGDIVSRTITSVFSFFHLPLEPLPLLAIILALFIVKGVAHFVARYTNSRVVAHFEEHTRRDLFEKTLKADWPYLLNQNMGKLETILTYDVDRASVMINNVTNVILFLTTFLMYALVAFSISVRITLLTLMLGAMIFFLLKPVFYRIRKLIAESNQTRQSLIQHVSEHVLGTKVIKATGTDSAVMKKVQAFFRQLRDSRIKTSWYRQSTLIFMEPIGFIVIGILFVTSYRSPDFDIASFAVIMFLIQKMFSFLQSLQSELHNINESIPFLRSVLAYREETLAHGEQAFGNEPFEFQKELTFEKVKFAYTPGQEVLGGITFSIRRGEFMGLIGPSGAGKTTVVDLILRLLQPREGKITIDGTNISYIDKQSWHAHVGYVPQDGFLLNDTIENNIRFYDSSLTMDDIIEAAKSANIYNTIRELPNGFETIAGPRGFKLSGGQRQRITLARALARKPDILILDEATSALDNESEAMIQKSINDLHGKTTVIMIAHRTSTVMGADSLIALEDGTITEKGTPEMLLKNPGSYFHRMSQIVKN